MYIRQGKGREKRKKQVKKTMNENKIKDIAESIAITSQRPLTPYNIERLKELAIELFAELDK